MEKVKVKQPKIIGLKQLFQMTYNFLPGIPADIERSFGNLVEGFIMLIWGISGNGKSNFLMKFLKCLMAWGKVWYLALEEGTRATMQKLAMEHLSAELHSGKIEFGNHEWTYDLVVARLKKKKSAKIVVVDSLQYWDITYEQYKALKEMFPRKIFIFISHAVGKEPDGKVASKIRYDADIKARVVGYVVFVISRLGGNRPFVIWEDGAKAWWGGAYKTILTMMGANPPAIPKKTPVKRAKKKKTADEAEESQPDTEA